MVVGPLASWWPCPTARSCCNAPNPFNSKTILSYFLPVAAPVRVEVFARTGQRIHYRQWRATCAAERQSLAQTALDSAGPR